MLEPFLLRKEDKAAAGYLNYIEDDSSDYLTRNSSDLEGEVAQRHAEDPVEEDDW